MNKEALADRYRAMNDTQLEKLAKESYKLTPLAIHVLIEEVQKRGLDLSISAIVNREEPQNNKRPERAVFSGDITIAAEEYQDALKVFYIKKKTLAWRSYLLYTFGVALLAVQIIDYNKLLLFIGFSLIFVGYLLMSSADKIPQLVLYPDYLLFIPSSNKVKHQYADVYNMFINPNFSQVSKEDILDVIKLDEFTNSAAIAIQVAAQKKMIPLLLIIKRSEVNDIYNLLKETYLN
ncbi:MAG: hypothetical protein HRU41_20155 [Saprospiraceae bacterium]|nr:hypothetical protein [Saprospiraceae bacterium]